MNHESLRRRNKIILLDSAFNIFPLKSGDIEKQKKYWLERMLNGHDVQDLLNQLKSGQPVLETEETPTTLTTSTLGRVRIEDNDLYFNPAKKRKLLINVFNSSEKTFETTEKEPLKAAYHWYDSKGHTYEYNGQCTSLPQPIRPFTGKKFEIDIIPPAVPGRYSLMTTLILEGQFWLEEKGLDVCKQEIEVTEPKPPGMTKRAQQIYSALKKVSD